jgi:hypothetical protein
MLMLAISTKGKGKGACRCSHTCPPYVPSTRSGVRAEDRDRPTARIYYYFLLPKINEILSFKICLKKMQF